MAGYGHKRKLLGSSRPSLVRPNLPFELRCRKLIDVTGERPVSKIANSHYRPFADGRISRKQTVALVDDRLIDELLHQLAEIGPLRARRLRH
jgi:hypothetical protein